MRACVVAVCLVALLQGVLEAQGPGGERRGGGPPGGRARPQEVWTSRLPEFHGERNGPPSATVATGYLFVDGAYVPGPYEIQRVDTDILVNDRAVSLIPPGQDSRREGGGRGWPPERNAPRPSAQRLIEQFREGAALVVFEGQTAVVLEGNRATRLLRVLCEPNRDSKAWNALWAVLPAHAERTTWERWLESYEPPAELRAQAEEAIREIETIEEAGETAIAANLRLQTWAYPLTVFGMLASVVAFGYLVQYPPHGSYDVAPSRRRRDLCRATVVFLGMIVVLSGLDLTWTLLVSQAGQMQELNPLGRTLIDDPWLLSGFKVFATLGSCGLLLALRRHPRAQLASWWMCLVCTLLTFRWLVLNSMFVS